MSLRWMLFLTAEFGFVGIGALGIGIQSAHAADGISAPAVAAPAAASPAPETTKPVTRSPKEWHETVSAAVRRADTAKKNNRATAVKSLLTVYQDLGRDVLLPAKERLRLGVQMRTRLQRFVSQFQYEAAHGKSRGGAIRSDSSLAGAAGGPAVEGLDSLIEVIQSTIGRPDDWVAVGQAGNGPALVVGGMGVGGIGAGGVGVGFGGGGAARGGAFGGNDALDKATAANGADLVDLIQKTVDPPSWDVNGGPGSIMYFNNLRILVVRQTGDGQDDVGGVLGGLRNH